MRRAGRRSSSVEAMIVDTKVRAHVRRTLKGWPTVVRGHRRKTGSYILDPKGSQSIYGFHPKAQERGMIAPEVFLHNIDSGFGPGSPGFDDASYHTIKDRMLRGLPMEQPLFVDFDESTDRITGHEGRHRAYVARELGVHWLPFVAYHYVGRDYTTPHMSVIKRMEARQ